MSAAMAEAEEECGESRALSARLAALSPLTGSLARSVTCPICLDYIADAQQLHCGHIFCAECVSRMLGMPKARCAICKRKTSKRMIRAAPVDFAEIVDCLRALELVVQESAPPPQPQREAAAALNDGFAASTGRQLAVRRVSGVRRSLSPPPPPPTPARRASAVTPARAPRNPLPERPSPGLDGCVMCPPRATDAAPHEPAVERGKLAPVAGADGRGLLVHELCGLYSADAYEVDDEFWNVARALRAARDATCARASCAGGAPTARCTSDGCARRYHYACAVRDGAKLVVDGFKLFCAEHVDDAPDIDDDRFRACLEDPTGTQCLDHDDLCWQCDTGGNLLLCDSCPRVVHPACAGLRSIPIGDYNCANCEEERSPSPDDSECTPNGTPETGEAAGGARRAKRKRAARAPRRGAKRMRRAVHDGARASPAAAWRPVLCSTGLDDAQKVLLKGVAARKRTPIRREFDAKVTHMIVNAFVPESTPTRTMKLCKAVAGGVKLVCFKWIEDSLESDAWLDVDAYVHPWTRCVASQGALFADSRFYFGALRGVTPSKEELIAIVRLGGGTVLNREPTIDMAPCTSKLYVIQDSARKRQGGRRNSYVCLADNIPGAEVVDPSWILDRCTATSNAQARSS